MIYIDDLTDDFPMFVMGYSMGKSSINGGFKLGKSSTSGDLMAI